MLDLLNRPKIIISLWMIVLVSLLVVLGCRDRYEPMVNMVESHFPGKAKKHSPRNCFSCHEDIFKKWSISHHALANRPIDPRIDGIAFPSESVTKGNEIWHFERNGNDLSVRIVSGETEKIYPVIGMIGEYPIWQYLVEFEGGRFQTLEITFYPEEKSWYPVFGSEIRHPGEWGHWSSQGMNWNANCAFCHMTDYKKNYDFETNSYQSEWMKHGIACYQCHGDMQEHIKKAEKLGDDYVSPPVSEFTNEQHLDNCASCHSLREQLTPDDFKIGENFDDHFRLVFPDITDTYHPDGQVNGENYVYAAFRMSTMYEKGVTCMDCHDPHTAELKLPSENNAVCMQCHGSGQKNAIIINPLEHSFHSEESAGNQCIECHMPQNLYMGKDWRRDHRFTSPDPQLTLETGTPNSCNRCHKDKSIEWAKEWVDQWYPNTITKTNDKASYIHKVRMMGQVDETRWEQFYLNETNSIWRAVYLNTFMNFPQAIAIDKVKFALEDKDPLVRRIAINILGQIPGNESLIASYQNDPSRLVRLEVARQVSGRRKLSENVMKEFSHYFETNLDTVGGSLNYAQYLMEKGEVEKAVEIAKHAIDYDTLNDELYFQAAVFEAQAGNNNGAIDLLRRGLIKIPESSRIQYGLGLILAETGKAEEAKKAFYKAIEYDPDYLSAYYNLINLLLLLNQYDEANFVIKEGLLQFPDDAGLLQLQAMSSYRRTQFR